MILEIISLCLFTGAGGYDCDWFIIETDDNNYFPTLCSDKALGCTDYHKKHIWIIQSKKDVKDVLGIPVLYHEILHAMCECNWHDGSKRLHG